MERDGKVVAGCEMDDYFNDLVSFSPGDGLFIAEQNLCCRGCTST